MIKYRDGYKYQLTEDYTVELRHNPVKNIDTEYISINVSGKLTIKKGYAWDGASGPTIDTKNSMRGALVHDALYQLMREKLISRSYRIYADKEFYQMIREDGMSWLRAKIWYRSVRVAAYPFASPSKRKKIIIAP